MSTDDPLNEPLPAASTRYLLYPLPGAMGRSPLIQERFELQLRDFFRDRQLAAGPLDLLPDQPPRITLDQARWQQLLSVNRSVNASMAYQEDAVSYPDRIMLNESRDRRDLYNYGFDTWRDPLATSNPPKNGRRPAGDCEDFALAKRDALLALGWPPESLAVAVVGTPAGMHAVLVARTDRGDLVLNNDGDQNKIRQWFECGMDFFFLQRGANSAELADISRFTLPYWPYHMANVTDAVLPSGTRARMRGVEIDARQPLTLRTIEHSNGLSDLQFNAQVDGQPESMRLQPAPHGALILQWLRRNSVRALHVPAEAITPTVDGTRIDRSKLRVQDLLPLDEAIATAREMGIAWQRDAQNNTVTLPSYLQARSLTPPRDDRR